MLVLSGGLEMSVLDQALAKQTVAIEEEDDRGEFHELEHFDDKMEWKRKMVKMMVVVVFFGKTKA